MPDCIPNASVARPPWQDRLTSGDVVSFRFPVTEEAGGPWPKARPCLVLETLDIDGARHALVAYGTSARTRANRGLEVELRRAEDRLVAGLDRRTRFVAARRVLVPLDAPAFVACAALGTPVLGHLRGGVRARLEAVRARLGEERDGAGLPVPSNRPRPVPLPLPGCRRRRTWPRLAAGRRAGGGDRGDPAGQESLA